MSSCSPRSGTCSPIRVSPGRLLDWAARTLKMMIEVVRKPADQRAFQVHPRQWVVKRTLAWLTAHRRPTRDYERDPEVTEELIRWAAINQLLRRLARETGPPPATTTSPNPLRPW